ncbi:MAG: sn-glycerol-3-phosphate ABC transporter ATP-binding protein UgpC [Ancalomicrobiaceae bacterium]|nr:sn-glycerol-3-phosphate ABC transporter ATP-binding protein UgpC [Ancalomicrobiaceae bacterium]
MKAITIEGATKNFGPVQVLKGIDLAIEPGEFVVLIGPSGCGKSTLLRMIAGLDDLTSGSISIDGRRVNDLAPKDRDIAMVFQSYALYPHMTVRGNMSFSLKLKRTASQAIGRAVANAANLLGIETLIDRKPRELSGGQRQRVAMGRAIVRKPKAFLFDEPLSNLDARLREQMRFEIRKLHRDLGATSVYVTHDQIEAMTMADRIVAMNGGIIQQVGSPLELYDEPANLFVAGFIGSPAMNVLSASCIRTGAGTELRLGASTLAMVERGLDGVSVTLGIRPERVRLATADSGIAAELVLVEPTGLGTVAHLNLGGQLLKLFTTERPRISAGETIYIRVEPDDIRLFDPETGVRI